MNAEEQQIEKARMCRNPDFVCSKDRQERKGIELQEHVGSV